MLRKGVGEKTKVRFRCRPAKRQPSAPVPGGDGWCHRRQGRADESPHHRGRGLSSTDAGASIQTRAEPRSSPGPLCGVVFSGVQAGLRGHGRPPRRPKKSLWLTPVARSISLELARFIDASLADDRSVGPMRWRIGASAGHPGWAGRMGVDRLYLLFVAFGWTGQAGFSVSERGRDRDGSEVCRTKTGHKS